MKESSADAAAGQLRQNPVPSDSRAEEFGDRRASLSPVDKGLKRLRSIGITGNLSPVEPLGRSHP